MTYYVIGDEETVVGFRLAGLPGRVSTTPFETREALEVAVATEGVRIILINERLAAGIKEDLKKYYPLNFPLIIQIPDRHGPMEGRKSINDMIQSAVGVKI